MMSDFKTPEVGQYLRHAGRVLEINDVTPPPPKKDIEYIVEDTSAKLDLMINGNPIKCYGVFNNHYGEGTCVDEAIKEAKDILRSLGNTDAEMVVTKITDIRKMKIFDYVNDDLYNRGFLKLMPKDSFMVSSTEELVWSSKSNG